MMNGRKLNWMNLNRESMRGNWCKMNWRSTIPFYLIMTHPNYSVEKKIQLYCWVSPPLPAKNSTIFFLLLHELNQLGINQCLIESPLIISYIDQQKKKKNRYIISFCGKPVPLLHDVPCSGWPWVLTSFWLFFFFLRLENSRNLLGFYFNGAD